MKILYHKRNFKKYKRGISEIKIVLEKCLAEGDGPSRANFQ